jgi:hypothetical protein
LATAVEDFGVLATPAKKLAPLLRHSACRYGLTVHAITLDPTAVARKGY